MKMRRYNNITFHAKDSGCASRRTFNFNLINFGKSHALIHSITVYASSTSITRWQCQDPLPPQTRPVLSIKPLPSHHSIILHPPRFYQHQVSDAWYLQINVVFFFRTFFFSPAAFSRFPHAYIAFLIAPHSPPHHYRQYVRQRVNLLLVQSCLSPTPTRSFDCRNQQRSGPPCQV